MKRLPIFILCLGIYSGMYAQKEVSWELLSKITWAKTYVEELKDYYDLPRFHADIKALEGKEVIISGFSIPLEVGSKTFALSAKPIVSCFFCTGVGFETIAEVIVKNDDTSFDKIKTDQFIKIKGTFKANRKDPEHLMYILENVKLVELKK